MSDWFVQILLGVLGFAGLGLGAWATVRVGKGANKQKAISDQRSHELGLIQRYQEALDSTEQRMKRRIDDLDQEVQQLRDEIKSERSLRRDSDSQRDAAVHHARELREAWPNGPAPIAVPAILADFLCE